MLFQAVENGGGTGVPDVQLSPINIPGMRGMIDRTLALDSSMPSGTTPSGTAQAPASKRRSSDRPEPPGRSGTSNPLNTRFLAAIACTAGCTTRS